MTLSGQWLVMSTLFVIEIFKVSSTEHKLRLRFKEKAMTESRCDRRMQFLTHLHKPLVFLAGGDVTER